MSLEYLLHSEDPSHVSIPIAMLGGIPVPKYNFQPLLLFQSQLTEIITAMSCHVHLPVCLSFLEI